MKINLKFQTVPRQRIPKNSLIANSSNLRVKRSDDDKTLVDATTKGDYLYRLNPKDIANIVRIEHKHYQIIKSQFEIISSLPELKKILKKIFIKTKAQNTNKNFEARFTLFIYHPDSMHWSTLVIYSAENNYLGFYADSKSQALADEFQVFFDEKKIKLIILTNNFVQQEDIYNSGLWALENAADLNRMIQYKKEDLFWCIRQLKQIRSKDYFDLRRNELSQKLYYDLDWRQQCPDSLANIKPEKVTFSFETIQDLDASADNGEPFAKRLKISYKKNANYLLSIFTESFLSSFFQQLATFHIIARGNRLTMEALKAELKSELISGATGALLGLGISQGIVGNSMGVIPSMVASTRTIIGKLLAKKGKGVAKKITKYFDTVNKETLTRFLCEAAIHIFYSYEYQFMHITDKAGDRVAMEKLADDAVDRAMNFLNIQTLDDGLIMSNELIEKAILQGPSETFLDLRLRKLQLKTQGRRLLNDKFENIAGEIPINTAKLYEKVGLITFDSNHQPNKLYESKNCQEKYGYRRLLNWEKNENGDINESLHVEYTEKSSMQEYHYVLMEAESQAHVQSILDKINTHFLPGDVSVPNQKKTKKQSIYFDLREPVADFTGRAEIRAELHRILTQENNMAVISALSALSIHSPSTSRLETHEQSSGSQLSISGLGGIGKTQLALQYAKDHAKDYDHNILWINAETKENLSCSFTKLARKLQLQTKDCYNQNKNLEEIVEAIYEYFSDRKSLFILDNVEDYREIESYLPKSMRGNKPTILITSRYSNWSNVATVFSLNVFTEQETLEFFKKSLGENSSEEDIKLLNRLLQGLPLALKQAITYINLQRLNAYFSVENYINCYKEKAKILLGFNFAEYSNDPYLKTVFTTYMVSLDKIKEHSTKGIDAIDLLYMMAYLDPEYIPSELFYNIKKINKLAINTFYILKITDDNSKNLYINDLMYFLKSYSMINAGSQSGQFTIHRVIQQVLRIKLESDKQKFLGIIETLQVILKQNGEYYKDLNYLHFLLYMSEHRDKNEVRSILGCDSIILFFNCIAKIAEMDITYWHYFLDLAYLKYPKKKFLEFLSDALSYSRKEGYCNLVSDILWYLGTQFDQKKFTQDQLQYVMNQLLHSKEQYKFTRFSNVPEKRRQQEYAFQLIGEFKIKVLGRLFPEFIECAKKKRSLCLSKETQKKLEIFKREAVRSHIEKVGLATHLVGSGLMSKNILSAIVRGDWDEVAINFELIASSEVLGKLSNHLLTQGKYLEDEALLEKNLDLENQKLRMLFVNKEITLTSKKLFLGKSLQVASSFVNRGTSVYFAYNLGKQIKAYEAGKTELLPEIISNGVITGITLTEISLESLEYLKYIARVAGNVNLYLEAIAALVWLGAEVYEAEEQIQIIQKHVHLSWAESYVEFVRSFFHYSPSSYLVAKANNAQLVEHAVNFLKNHTDFSRYIVPIFSPELKLYENNLVLLDYRRLLTLDNTMPDQPSVGRLFCQTGIPNTHVKHEATYFCSDAMGVEYHVNRSAEINLINLGTGNDTVFAFPDFPNYFLVQNGEKKYWGGDAGNIFRLDGNATIGRLIGGKKSDVLLLEQFSPEESAFLLIDRENYLCGQQQPLIYFESLPCDFNKIKLSKLNQIYGRSQQQDVIYLNSDIHFIDGYGGTAGNPDVFFMTERTYKNPRVILRNNTLVLFSFKTDVETMDYRIPKAEMGKAEIQTYFCLEIQHRFFFDCAFENIVSMHVQNHTFTISVLSENDTDSGTFTIEVSDPSVFNLEYPYSNVTNFEKRSSYFFQNMEIKLINNHQLFVKEITRSNQTTEEYIDRFSDMAKYLDRTITSQLQENVILTMGRGNHEVFYVDGSFPSHLVGNGGENVYQVTANNATYFPLAQITLHRLPSYEPELTERIDTLDLRELVGCIKKTCPKANIMYQLSLIEEDVSLMLMSSTSVEDRCSKVKTTWYLADIRLKTGIDWYQNLDILLEDAIPKHIVTHDGEEWTLIDRPLIFTENKKIITLTHKDLGENTEISLLRNSGNYSCFRNASDLIVTNVHTNPLDGCTIVAYDYYHNPVMKKKLLSAKLNFLDAEFCLKDYKNLMDEAQSFTDFVKQLEKPGSITQHSPIAIPILLPYEELSKLRLKRYLPMTYTLEQKSHDWVPFIILGLSSTFLILAGSCMYRRLQTAVISLIAASLPVTHAQQTEEAPLDFGRGFSIERRCFMAETSMGWLGVCQNHDRILYLKAYQNFSSLYFESYQINGNTLQRDGAGVWETNPCKITINVLAEEIYLFLPPHWQNQFREKQIQQQVLTIWKQRALMSVAQSLNDGLVLHTPVGDLFKALGLAPEWKAREDRYLLNRCWWAFEQQLFRTNLMSTPLSLGIISAELALLHPITKRMYTTLTQQEDISKAKFVVRFLMDVLQLGFYNIGHLAHALDYCFPANESAKNISLGLRMANYFYFLTGDLNYWHLGMALFFLPQIPQLLDHLGIAATRGLQRFCNQLATCLLGHTLLQKLSADEERQAQADRELSRADVRVQKARQRLNAYVTANASFFPATNISVNFCSANDEGKETSMAFTII